MTILNPNARKQAIIDAARAAKNAPKTDALTTRPQFVKPEEATNKIRIVFDDSGSMDSPLYKSTAIEEAKKGMVEFLRYCVPNKDAVAIHLLSKYDDFDYEPNLPSVISAAKLETDLIKLASAVDSINAVSGTPLFEALLGALEDTPSATRIVAFSDGSPNNRNSENTVIKIAKEKKIPIDTVFFGSTGSSAANLMKSIAERTGGIFITFDPARGVKFSEAFKYLTPQKRLMLMDAEFKRKLEAGDIK